MKMTFEELQKLYPNMFVAIHKSDERVLASGKTFNEVADKLAATDAVLSSVRIQFVRAKVAGPGAQG